MNKQELQDLLLKVSPKNDDGQVIKLRDYSSYGKFEKMDITPEEFKKAIDVLSDIVLNLTKDERDSKYLFDSGLTKARDVYLVHKKNESDFSPKELKDFREREIKFAEKLENIRPAVEFLIKIKEII